ncbi:hypothetical protein [Mesorhizobium shangrilense]|uniref:Serine protease n=1 Tax=Mesorhizobium shangrilense TaxID=460060 RepID=A0ABV2DBR3_9HYPH
MRGQLSMSKARRIVTRCSGQIYTKKNVALVSIGEKRIEGRRSGQRAIVVYVHKKENVDPSDLIPPHVTDPRSDSDTIQTDVVALIGRPRTFGVRSGNIIVGADNVAGVCTIGFEKSGAQYILTNAHIGRDVAQGGQLTSLRVLDPQSGRYVALGPAVWASQLPAGGLVDSDIAVAIAQSTDVDPFEIQGITASIDRQGNFASGTNFTFWFIWNGVEFECAHPEPVSEPSWIDVEGVQIQYQDFWILQMTKGASAPGQSGALICRTDLSGSIIACGVVFGGSAPDRIFAFSFQKSYEIAINAIA